MNKTCFICGSDKWESVDHLRAKPANMVVCRGCGFITFERFETDSDYKQYYDAEYRKSKMVNVSNLITTNRKLGYHQAFLGEFLASKKDMAICDIGCGIGYFLRYCREKYGHKRIYGVELTSTYRRYAENAFDIIPTPELDITQRYNLVSCYHTLEHVPDPVELLNKVKGCLAPEGKLYIATPIWMEEMFKFGGGQFGSEDHPFDEHFHPDHVNAWSRWHLSELLAITGWRTVKQNPKMYGWTLLLEPCKPRPYQPPPKGTEIFPWAKVPDDVILQLSDMKRAATSLMKGQLAEAMRLYPPTVDAILAEIANSFKDIRRQMELIKMGKGLCPNTVVFDMQEGLIFYQRQDYEMAEKCLLKALEHKPHDDNILMHLGLIYLKKGEALIKTDQKLGKETLQRAVSCFDMIAGVNPTMFAECFNFSAYAMSICPGKSEEGKDLENGDKFECPHTPGAPHIDLKKEMLEIGSGGP